MANNNLEDQDVQIPYQDSAPLDIIETIIRYLSLVTHERDLDRQLMLLADLGKEITGSDRCTVWVHQPENDTLWTKVAHGIDRVVLASNLGIVGACFTDVEDIIINDAYSDPRFDKNIDKQTGYYTRNILALPLTNSKGGCIGVFQAINKLSLDKKYSPLDVKRAFLISSYVGRLLETCILYNQVRQSENLLRESQERLKNVIEATNDGFFDWQVNMGKVFVSPAWQKEMIGDAPLTNFYQISRQTVVDDDKEKVAAVFGEFLSPQNDSYEIEYRAQTLKGKVIWVEERGRVIEWSGDSQINRLVGTFKDVTARKMAQHEKEKLQAQLNHIQRLESLGVMAGGVAHDYNNMLTTIIGNAEFGLMDTSEDDPVRECFEQIKISATRSAELTKQLLDYSGKGKIHSQEINMNNMIQETLQLVKASLAKKIQLKLDLDKSIPDIVGDISQIRQVLMNLIINASDSLEKNTGMISIRTSVRNLDHEAFWFYSPEELTGVISSPYVCLEVSDNGSGIDEENITKIFEPFFSTKTSGRGLGLAATLGIVKGHRGGLKVTSQLNHGTTFLLQFPQKSDFFHQKLSGKSLAEANDERKKGTILIADDESTLLKILCKMLERDGYKVFCAENGKIAVDLFVENNKEIDLLLFDNNMPVMTGIEAGEKIREIAPEIPVLIISGNCQKEDFSGNFRPNSFVQKPFFRQQIIAEIEKQLKPTPTTD